MCDCAFVSSGLFGGDGADERQTAQEALWVFSVVELLRHVIPSQWSLWRSKHTELGSNRVLVAVSEILALPDAAHHLVQLAIENLFPSNNQSDV